MTILENPELLLQREELPQSFYYVRSSDDLTYFDGEKPINELEVELEDRFSYERITDLTLRFLKEKLGDNWRDACQDKKLVGVLEASGEYKDIAAFVETTRFSRMFNRPNSQIYKEYADFDDSSIFAVAIDTSLDKPFPIGSLRMTLPGGSYGFKTVRDFLRNDPRNPWLDEVKSTYFSESEVYDIDTAWERIEEASAEKIDKSETLDIPTLAALEEYAANGSFESVSLALYHTCLQFARTRGYKNLLSIQDLRPLSIIQSFGDPFDLFPEISPKINEGEFPGIPAYAVIARGMQRIRDNDQVAAAAFIDGLIIDQEYVLSEHYDESFAIRSVANVVAPAA